MRAGKLSRRSFMKASAGAVAAVRTGRGAATPPRAGKSSPLRMGAPLFKKVEDPGDWAARVKELGYSAAYCPVRVGELRLEIPQVRGLSFYPKSLERGCRSEKALKLAIAEMYVMGVSTRKVTEITEQLCGLEISATQVSRVAGMLDEELEEYPIVYLDAHYEKVRRGGRVQDVAILKAIGVNRFGTREVLGLSARISEAEVHWRGFLGDLHKRGEGSSCLSVTITKD